MGFLCYCTTGLVQQVAVRLTESRMMLMNVLLKRMQNCVMQLAEKLWQPSEEDESCRKTVMPSLHRLYQPQLNISNHNLPVS